MVQNSSKLDKLERVLVCKRRELRACLSENHAMSPSIWLITFRKVTGQPRPVIGEEVEELPCFGWIDGKLAQIDETQTMLLCIPRNPKSHWSRINKERVHRLTEQGQMQPRSLQAVAVAKANGNWDFLDEIDGLREPDDLARALVSSTEARRHWDAFPASCRKGILYWIRTAKRPETRATRIEAAVSSAASNTRLQGSTRASTGKKQ